MAKLTPTSRITPIIYPPVDSITAIQLNKADGTTNILNVDTTNSRVGIGTTSPLSQLDIGGLITTLNPGLGSAVGRISANTAAITGIDMRNTSSGTGAEFRFTVSDNAGDAYLAFTMPSTGNTSTLFGQTRSGLAAIFVNATTTNRDLAIGTIGSKNLILGTANAERMRINSSGNVGIGTTSPTNLLSLGGNSARIFWLERHTTANTAGNTLTITAGGATSAATDKAGGALILQGGLSTGTGESGVTIQGCVAGATGTADRTQTTAIQVLGNKIGVFNTTPAVQQNHIIDADGTLADITTKFNTLLLALETYGWLKSA